MIGETVGGKRCCMGRDLERTCIRNA